MTVIAYKDGVLATDTLMVIHERKAYTQKLFEHAGSGIAICGDFARGMELLDWFKSGAAPESYPAKRSPDDFARLVVANDKGVSVYENGPFPFLHSEEFLAYGSGADFAVGAMAMGASAAQAVRVAIVHSASCGGEVCSLTIGELHQHDLEESA